MVAVASVGQRQDVDAAVLAGEALILGGSGDGCVSGLKGSSTRGAGFRVLFPKDPGLVGRGTDSPPFLLGRRLLPVPASSGLVASPNPDHDRGCGIVSATVKQETHFPPVGVIPAALALASSPVSRSPLPRNASRPLSPPHEVCLSALNPPPPLPATDFDAGQPPPADENPQARLWRREVDQPRACGWVKRDLSGCGCRVGQLSAP